MKTLPLKVSPDDSNNDKVLDAFDEWWADEHGTGKLEIEDGVGETEEDYYGDE